jgi:hypothetical protein
VLIHDSDGDAEGSHQSHKVAFDHLHSLGVAIQMGIEMTETQATNKGIGVVA